MPFRGVVFDLDGTLIDSTSDIAWSTNTLLARHGYPTHPVEAFSGFIGDGVAMLLTRALPPAARTPERIASLGGEFRDLYAGHWNVETRAYPGIKELVSALRGRGVRLAVLSNKPHDFTVRCVEHFFPRGVFDVVLGAGGRFPNKPNPEAARHIAQTLGIAATEILYLGDTDTDMQTATNAGMRAVGVLWGLRTRDELLLNGAQALLKEPMELMPLFGETD